MLLSNYSGHNLEVGLDESGRGCLSGAVVAAAVIFPSNISHSFLNDSKQLSESKRNQLRIFIEKNSLSYGVSYACQKEIDKINILQASILAMHRALDMLKTTPEFIIIDGNKFNNYRDIPYKTIVKGDSKYLSIAAASILAKTYRDEYMNKIHKEFPVYNWKQNKGYPTKEHRRAISKFGITKYHRRSFKLLA